jgi:hypothetical protein
MQSKQSLNLIDVNRSQWGSEADSFNPPVIAKIESISLKMLKFFGHGNPGKRG